jgi:hypothetical protein
MEQIALGGRLIFIGGAPRSGTTLLQSLMNSHPDIYGGPEFDLVPSIINLRNQLHSSIRIGRISDFCNEAQVNVAIGNFIESLLLPTAERNHKTFLSEKTPMNVLAFPALLGIFSQARFIHAVRDPRAVTISMIKVAERYRKQGKEIPAIIASAEAILNTIVTYVTHGWKASQQAPHRVYTIFYEKLISQPEQEMKALCEFLQIQWNKAMLHPGNQTHSIEKLLQADGGLWADKRVKLTNPEPENLDKWKAGLTKENIAYVSETFEQFDVFRKLGYRFDLDHDVSLAS